VVHGTPIEALTAFPTTLIEPIVTGPHESAVTQPRRAVRVAVIELLRRPPIIDA